MLLIESPVLQVGDRLRVVCPELPELCVDRCVTTDGTIDFPLLGPLPAVARNVEELQQTMVQALRAGGGAIRIEVRFVGQDRDKVAVKGAVAHSLSVFAPHGIDRDRLLKAARPLPDADLALLPTAAKVSAGMSLDIPTITVERRINIVGAVASPRSLSPALNLTLDSAIRMAGGLTTHANPNRLVVVRLGEAIPLILPEDAGFRLQPGDVVRVMMVSQRRYVLVRGLVAKPGSVEYAPGMTALRALADAGGSLPAANSGTLVWRTGAKSFRLSLAFLLSHRIPDPVLGADDSLTVEAGKP